MRVATTEEQLLPTEYIRLILDPGGGGSPATLLGQESRAMERHTFSDLSQVPAPGPTMWTEKLEGAKPHYLTLSSEDDVKAPICRALAGIQMRLSYLF